MWKSTSDIEAKKGFRMKIVFITSSFNGGGITSYAHEVIDCFSEGNEMIVIVGDDSKAPLDRSRTNVVACDSSDISLENARRLLRIINDDICPDVIINSNSVLMTLISPFVKNDIRIITVSHSLCYQEADTAGFNSHYVDRVIALSTYNEDYLRKQYNIKDEKKVRVIYNFVKELPEAARLREQKKSAAPLRIVFPGGTSAAKSPELVFKILRRLLKTDYSFEFVFMGPNAPTLHRLQPFKSVKQLLKQDDRLKFTGRVSREEAERIIGTANILLVPSRREGCPMAMLEGMRVGCIVLTSDYKNACREMIEDNRSGFVINHRDVASFTARISDIIDCHEEYLSFYDECYADFINKFNYIHWKEKMQELIYDNRSCHKIRYKYFSEKKYIRLRLRLQRRFKRDVIHKMFHETLLSALSFFGMYIKTWIRK